MQESYKQILEKNLDWLLDHELESPEYYGARILDISERLGI